MRPGNEAHGRTAMPCARRRCGRRAALRQVDEDEVRRAGVDGGAGQPAQALGEVGPRRRAVSCAMARAWSGRAAMASMAASASALTDQAGRWARSLAARGTGARR